MTRASIVPLLVALASTALGVGCKNESAAPIDDVPGGAGIGTSGVGGGGGEAPSCETWPGPFDTYEGDIIDPTLRWDGFEPGASEVSTVSLADYAACGDGDDVTAIVVLVDGAWCGPCRDVASGLAERYATDWKARGIRVISLLIQDEDTAPADVEDAWRWRDEFGLEDIAVGFDPAFSLANDVDRKIPQTIVIDPTTMRIAHRVVGNVGIQPLIDDVVDGNTD